MAFVHGRTADVYIDGIDWTCYLNQASASNSVEAAETTTFCKDSKTYIPGLADGTISISGFFDSTADAAIVTKLQSATNPVVTLIYGGNGTLTAGLPVTTGAGVVTSLETSASVGDVISMSAELQGSDWVRSGRLIGLGTTASATGNEATSHNNGAATSNGGYATLHIHTNTRGTTGVTYLLEDSADNNTFLPISGASFTVSGLSGTTEAQRITFSGTVRQYVRLAWTISGGSGNAKAVASYVRL